MRFNLTQHQKAYLAIGTLYTVERKGNRCDGTTSLVLNSTLRSIHALRRCEVRQSFLDLIVFLHLVLT